MSAAHKQALDKAKIHEISGAVRGIVPTRRLIPAKMTTFGGLYSVRGYGEDEMVADGGILTSLEYKFGLTRFLENVALNDSEQQPNSKKKAEMWSPDVSLITFFDHGRAKVKNPVPGEKPALEMYSTGLGTAIEIGNSWYGSAYYSWPLRTTDETKKGRGRWNFNVMYRW